MCFFCSLYVDYIALSNAGAFEDEFGLNSFRENGIFNVNISRKVRSIIRSKAYSRSINSSDG